MTKIIPEVQVKIAEYEARDCLFKAKVRERKAKRLAKYVAKREKSFEKSEKVLNFFRKTIPAQIMACAIIGAWAGLIASTHLYKSDNIVASVSIYLLSAVFLGGFFGWAGKMQAEELVKGFEENLDEEERQIKEICAEINDVNLEAKSLRRKSEMANFRVMKYGGVHL